MKGFSRKARGRSMQVFSWVCLILAVVLLFLLNSATELWQTLDLTVGLFLLCGVWLVWGPPSHKHW